MPRVKRGVTARAKHKKVSEYPMDPKIEITSSIVFEIG